MTADLARAARVLALPTAALIGVLAFAPGRAELALRIYALVLSAAALGLALAALRRAYPRSSPLAAASAGTPREPRRVPGTLARLEQETALGVAGSFDLHHRLRPRVRRLAADLLATRRGISLDAESERARAALGGATWELVRPERPAPEDRQARGIPISDLRAVVEALERL